MKNLLLVVEVSIIAITLYIIFNTDTIRYGFKSYKKPVRMYCDSSKVDFSGPMTVTVTGPDSIIYENVGLITISRLNKKSGRYDPVALKRPDKEWVIFNPKYAVESLFYVLMLSNRKQVSQKSIYDIDTTKFLGFHHRIWTSDSTVIYRGRTGSHDTILFRNVVTDIFNTKAEADSIIKANKRKAQ